MLKRTIHPILLLLVAFSLVSWGYLVHRTTHQLAVYALPKDMRGFYFNNIKYLVDSAPRPDMRRNTDSLEATRHFIDLEQFGDSAAYKLPLTWQEAIEKFSKDSLLSYGYVPYQVLMTKEKLTEAFRSRNADSIIYYSTDIGHYIADAHVPLHTSINYDGQLTNQRGLHSLWESTVPEIEIGNYNLRSTHKARYLKEPAVEIMRALQAASALLPDVFAKEIEVSKAFTDSQKYRVQVRRGKEYKNYSPEFAKAYAASLKSTINDQLIMSSNQIADFWYTCWVDGGKPDLDQLQTGSFDKARKKALKKELKSNKRNRLIVDGLLRAKTPAAPGGE
ncbi:hypothetical protein EXU57_18325 [Segetibacter sp. 3557_3]|nr:hypothetical protein EXU57_18325 [Segetibacter sp. 3557_3]